MCTPNGFSLETLSVSPSETCSNPFSDWSASKFFFLLVLETIEERKNWFTTLSLKWQPTEIMHGSIADVYIQSFSHYPSKQCKCKEAWDTDWNFLQRSATELKGNWHMQSHKSIDHISTCNLHRNFPFLDISFLWSTPPFGFFSTWNTAAAAVQIFINWRISCWA